MPANEKARESAKWKSLTSEAPSGAWGVAEASVIKSGNLFLLSDSAGNVPMEQGHGLGLYHEDCRYLNGLELRIGGRELMGLASSTFPDGTGISEALCPMIEEKGISIPKDAVSVRRRRRVDGDALRLEETIEIRNYCPHRLTVPVELSLRCEFEDIMVVRGLVDGPRGKPPVVRGKGGRLSFRYEGVDGLRRSCVAELKPAPRRFRGGRASLTFKLAPEKSAVVTARIEVKLEEPAAEGRRPRLPRGAGCSYLGSCVELRGDTLTLQRAFSSSLSDLRTLQSQLDGRRYVAAGLPWFGTLFGRDSLITALQSLMLDAELASDVLRLLGGLQGAADDSWREEEPGKILHELSRGELARAGAIPHTPFYGAVDTAPLFVILLARHARWTGDLGLFRELESHAARALAWMEGFSEFIGYRSKVKDGRLINQGWKDSGNAIVDAAGEAARSPIELVEVQAYFFEALTAAAGLYERAGRNSRAAALRSRARRLRRDIERRFWSEGLGCYAMGLGGGRQLRVLSSNAGHALWGGVPGPARARRIADALLGERMFSGWGVRTLARGEKAYHPVSYHLGSVWPHDNALIHEGLRRYGLDGHADRIFLGIMHASLSFDGQRLPELFCGFSAGEFEKPVPYPVACHPQAWAAAAVPAMLRSQLGIDSDGFAGRITITRPRLPPYAGWLELRGLRAAGGSVDLRFSGEGSDVSVEVLRRRGAVEVVAPPRGKRSRRLSRRRPRP